MARNEDKPPLVDLAAMCLGLFMIMLDNTVVNVAPQSLTAGLHASYATLQWTVSTYTGCSACCLVAAGAVVA